MWTSDFAVKCTCTILYRIHLRVVFIIHALTVSACLASLWASHFSSEAALIFNDVTDFCWHSDKSRSPRRWRARRSTPATTRSISMTVVSTLWRSWTRVSHSASAGPADKISTGERSVSIICQFCLLLFFNNQVFHLYKYWTNKNLSVHAIFVAISLQMRKVCNKNNELQYLLFLLHFVIRVCDSEECASTS